MDSLLLGLEPSLGEGTRDLKVRIGLHSGPVTASALRGGKWNATVKVKKGALALHCSSLACCPIPDDERQRTLPVVWGHCKFCKSHGEHRRWVARSLKFLEMFLELLF